MHSELLAVRVPLMFSTTTHDEFYVQVTNTGLAYTLIGGFVVVVSPSTFVLLDFFGLQKSPSRFIAPPRRKDYYIGLHLLSDVVPSHESCVSLRLFLEPHGMCANQIYSSVWFRYLSRTK